MAVPLLLMAAKIVGGTAARAALKKGGQAALRAIVRQGDKAKKLAKKPTSGQQQVEKATKAQRAYAKGQVKAGAVAGAAGVAGTKAATKKEEKKSTPTPKPRPDQRTNPSDFPTYKKGTKSAKAFQEAFAKAKKEGNKTFKFEGTAQTPRASLRSSKSSGINEGEPVAPTRSASASCSIQTFLGRSWL